MSLPAGIIPSDSNIELFAKPSEFGKCFFIQNGTTKDFIQLPDEVLNDLHEEMLTDRLAVKGLIAMGIDPDDMLEQYNYCNRGELDGIPDIKVNGKRSKELVNCGRRGHCAGEGKVCGRMTIDGSYITNREYECLHHVGKDYKSIQLEMGFRNVTAVNSIMARLLSKLNCADKTQLALKAKEIGIL